MYILRVIKNNSIKQRMFIMQVRIRKNAFVSTCGIHQSFKKEFAQFIKDNEGVWLDVDTECLFSNQYNVSGYRVMDSHIDAVKDDARIGKGKCIYCGKLVNEGDECTHSEECTKYGIDWFTAKNTAFIAHPNGLPLVVHCKCEDEKKFGSFVLEQFSGALNFYRLRNNRSKFEFKYCNGYFYMENGGRKAHLGITAQSFKEDELKKYLQGLNDTL